MYTIYEIPGVKVGCTSRSPEVRVKEQGHTQFRVVEVVTDISTASEREKYWQEELGYRKDMNTYNGMLKMAKLAQTPEATAKRNKTQRVSEKYKNTRVTEQMNTPQSIAKRKETCKTSEKYKETRTNVHMLTPQSIAKKTAKLIKPVLQFDKQGGFIKEWPSIKEASNSLSIYRGDIGRCSSGKLKQAGGYIWKYKSML